MIVDIFIALVVSLVAMVAVGTVVAGILNLRSMINWLVQTAVIAGIVYLGTWTTPQVVVMLTLPAIIHLLTFSMHKVVEYRAAHGYYGEGAKWAYELFEEPDEQFIRAQSALPQHEVMEIKIIADSKEEFRDLMVERYNEVAQQSLSTNGKNT